MLEWETAVSHGASRKVPNPKPSGKWSSLLLPFALVLFMDMHGKHQEKHRKTITRLGQQTPQATEARPPSDNQLTLPEKFQGLWPPRSLAAGAQRAAVDPAIQTISATWSSRAALGQKMVSTRDASGWILPRFLDFLGICLDNLKDGLPMVSLGFPCHVPSVSASTAPRPVSTAGPCRRRSGLRSRWRCSAEAALGAWQILNWTWKCCKYGRKRRKRMEIKWKSRCLERSM